MPLRGRPVSFAALERDPARYDGWIARIWLEILSRPLYFSRVSQLKTTIAAVLLILWIPATSLCLLENAGLISRNDDCPAGQSSESSPCCALASATYKMDESPAAAAPLPVLTIAWFVDLPKLIRAPAQFAGSESGVSPPELSQSWRFSFRAALTPRAPSTS